MEVLGRAAERHLGRPLAAIEHVELYSCFPSAVRVQQRELQLPLDRVPTVTGGMAFAGGPFNNFTYQATAAIVQRLRADPGSLGLVTTVSGLLTKPGLMVWSTAPAEEPPLVADLGTEAGAATASVEVVDGYAGAARVASYTVTYDGPVPDGVIALVDTPDRRRCLATAADADLARWATTDELIGTTIEVRDGAFSVPGY
jgi:acetyl-CoA C-acetyltransferase